ncbi:type VI secretion system tube protein Hcp [Cohnella sp. GCM10020058]|uniref:type VI secretion system tube protein Hcp n=1 Tax=Cohnella sp. GCM10020058 TaxID=3317330 RepID=UPI00362D7241
MFARLLKKGLLTALIAGILLLSAFPPAANAADAAGAAPRILLKLDGIKGEYASTALNIQDAIVPASFRFGMDAPLTASGNNLPGKPVYRDIVITKPLDAASLPLLQTLTGGKHIADGYAYFQTESAGQSRTYLIVHLSDIRVTRYTVGGSRDAQLETVTLSARTVLSKYVPEQSGGPTNPDPDPDSADVMTRYHFDPINAVTAKGNPYVKGFKVTLRAAGNEGETLTTRYRINGGAWTEYAGPFEIYAADTHTVEYYSTGADGRVEETNLMDFDKGTFDGRGTF